MDVKATPLRSTLYTAQIGFKKEGLVLVDTTVKSAEGLARYLAPTWEMVNQVKSGEIDWAEYSRQYANLMRQNYRTQPEAFTGLLHSESPVVLMCYCQADKCPCCHRYNLVHILLRIAASKGHDCSYKGELK